MKIIFPTHFSSFNVEVLVLLVMKIIFPTHFSSFNVEALLPPSRLVLSCRLVSSLVFASLLFSFSFSFSSLPPLRLFQAGHALAHSRACRKTYKNLAFSTRFAGTRCQLGSISLTLSRRYSRQWLLHDFVLTPQPVHLPIMSRTSPLQPFPRYFFSLTCRFCRSSVLHTRSLQVLFAAHSLLHQRSFCFWPVALHLYGSYTTSF